MPIETTESGKSIDVTKSKIKKIRVGKNANRSLDKNNIVFRLDDEKKILYVITKDEAEDDRFGQPVPIPIFEDSEV